MTTRNLDHLFAPKSIAVIGASERPGSIGLTVMRNLREGGFAGAVYAVNPKHRTVLGETSYGRVAELPAVPDLAILCTPPPTAPQLIADAGAHGAKAAIVMTAMRTVDASRQSLQQGMLAAAKPHLLRILGPNCLGVLVPAMHLNASFAHTAALRGNVAFVSQSGALVTTVLDWATSRGIGFSKLVSLGDSVDVDFGDVIDYLASDDATRAILLYMEGVVAARKFMSAARAAARNKPVLVLKAARAAENDYFEVPGTPSNPASEVAFLA